MMLPRVEWIHCLTGVRGEISSFPSEMLAESNVPGVALRFDANGSVKICPDFRAREIFLNGKIMLSSEPFDPGVPVFLRMGKTLLTLCLVREDENWAKHYRFPLWTLFEPETFEPIETVPAPSDIPAALKRYALAPADCLVAPYGLPATVPLDAIFDLFAENPASHF